MDTKKEKLEDFKTATSSTVRSLSNSQKIEVSFGNQPSQSKYKTIQLPNIHQANNKINFEEIKAKIVMNGQNATAMKVLKI